MSKEDYDIRFYCCIDDFYNALDPIFHNGINNSPFQFKNWQELLYKEFVTLKKPGKYIGTILFIDGIPLCGGHFFYKNTGHKKGLFLLGS